MKRYLLTAISILFGAVFLFVPVSVMVYATLEIEKLRATWKHPFAVVAAVAGGTLLFVTTTYLATHLVVRLFRTPESPRDQVIS
jgi:putative effector of murein hydrolase LrgA (UPF0299 family)